MKIKTKIKIITMLSILLILIISIMNYLSIQNINKKNSKIEIAVAINKAVFELNILTNNYFIYYENRIKNQWQLRYKSLVNFLSKIDNINEHESGYLDNIRKKLSEIKKLFTKIDLSINRDTVVKGLEIHHGLNARLINQIILHSQDVFNNSSLLMSGIKNDLLDAQKKSNLAIVFFTCIIVGLICCLFSWIIIKDILRSIIELQKGIQIIGEENLDHRVNLEKNDEIGELAVSFNEMTTKLQKANEQIIIFQKFVEASEQGLGIASLDGTIVYVNPSLCKFTGENSLNDMIGKTFVHYYPKKLSGKLENEIMPCIMKNGSWSGELMLNSKNASIIYTYESFFLIKDDKGNPIYIADVINDITERKHTELELLKYKDHLELLVKERTNELAILNNNLIKEIQLHQQTEKELRINKLSLQKLNTDLKNSNEELEKFAYIASHDLQEPLRKVLAFSDRLKIKYSNIIDEKGHDYIDRMQNAANRMRIMIKDLLSLSRVTTSSEAFVDVDLNDILKEVLSDLEIRINETNGLVEISDLPIVKANPLQMNQLFGNLINNALKFHRDNIKPHIKIFSDIAESINFSNINLNISLKNDQCNNYKTIFIEDNCIGFDQKYCDKIFQPFQRLHGRNKYEGSGIGLSICRKIVERHDGNISVNSIPDKGSIFIIILK